MNNEHGEGLMKGRFLIKKTTEITAVTRTTAGNTIVPYRPPIITHNWSMKTKRQITT